MLVIMLILTGRPVMYIITQGCNHQDVDVIIAKYYWKNCIISHLILFVEIFCFILKGQVLVLTLIVEKPFIRAYIQTTGMIMSILNIEGFLSTYNYLSPGRS